LAGIAALLFGLGQPAPCDTPDIPADQAVCSKDKRVCLAMLVPHWQLGLTHHVDPELRKQYPTSGLYRVRPGSKGRAQLLWQMDTTQLRLPIVLGDGDHVIDVSLSRFSDESLTGSENVLVFYSRGVATRTWILAEAIPGWRSLKSQQTASSRLYRWFCGVSLSADEATLQMEKCPLQSGEILKFDPRTGARR